MLFPKALSTQRKWDLGRSCLSHIYSVKMGLRTGDYDVWQRGSPPLTPHLEPAKLFLLLPSCFKTPVMHLVPLNPPVLSWLLITMTYLLIVGLQGWWTIRSSHPLVHIYFLLNPAFWEGIMKEKSGLQGHLVSHSAPRWNKPPLSPGQLVLLTLLVVPWAIQRLFIFIKCIGPLLYGFVFYGF